jgi:hypothetical protein
MRLAASFWTRARDRQAAALWLAGVNPCAIARDIGASRYAVVARMRRLRLPAQDEIMARRMRWRVPTMRPAVLLTETIVACSPRPWTTREEQECAYPVGGAGVDTLSCCNPTGGRRRLYCPEHHAAAHPPRPEAVGGQPT